MIASADGPHGKTACVIQWRAQRKDIASLMVMNPVWSKDSRRLFLAGGMDSLFSIMQFDLQTGQVQTLLLSSTGSAAVSPDGQWVATLLSRSSKQADLAVAKVDGQMTRYLKLALDPEKVDESDLALFSVISWAPDSKRVLVSVGRQMVVANVLTGEGRPYADPETDDVALATLTPAGDAITYLAGLKKEGPGSGQQAVQLRTLSLSNGKSRTLLRLAEGLNLKSGGAFSMAPSGKAAAMRCTTEDSAGKEHSLLVLWDGKTTKTVETDPWLSNLDSNQNQPPMLRGQPLK
jgi:dipeptidyl aminopeptidase/acylaminoacyl peptidase